MIKYSTGSTIPSTNFRVQEDNQWTDLSTDEIFNGKTVVVFSLPGAYTPTCSSSHLPRFNELAPVLKDNGVDEVVCVSVNDTFVMNEWSKGQEADNVTMIPDGNGDFTKGMGMLVSKRDLGFGDRSWRYSMLVKDGTVEKMFIEPDVEGDPFEVSDADTMLDYLTWCTDYRAVYGHSEVGLINKEAVVPDTATMFSRKGCPHCARAEAMLHKNNIHVEVVELEGSITSRSLRAVSGKSSTPQIFMGGKYIGGADELEEYFNGKD